VADGNTQKALTQTPRLSSEAVVCSLRVKHRLRRAQTFLRTLGIEIRERLDRGQDYQGEHEARIYRQHRRQCPRK